MKIFQTKIKSAQFVDPFFTQVRQPNEVVIGQVTHIIITNLHPTLDTHVFKFKGKVTPYFMMQLKNVGGAINNEFDIEQTDLEDTRLNFT